MNYKLLRKMVEAEINKILNGEEQRFSYLLEGPHGIGKSAFFKELAIDLDGYFIDIRLGQRDLGDIIGLPVIELDNKSQKHMVHIKPELVRKLFVKDLSELGLMGDKDDILATSRPKNKIGKPYKFIVALLDEYNRGTKDVQQAVFELVYDRSMNGDKINPLVFLAAACNDNIEIYTITEGDPAFRSRFKTIKYTPSVDEWLNWGKKKGELCPELLYVIEMDKSLADPPKDKDNNSIDFLNQPHTNRRSWHEFSKFYTNHKNEFNELEIRDICATFVGEKAAEIFRLMVKKMKETQEAAAQAENNENNIVRNFYDNFMRHRKWSVEVAKMELQKFSPSDLQALADYCIKAFGLFTYVVTVVKNQIFILSEILPREIFARIWNEMPNNGLREKLIAHAETVGKPDYFKQFEAK